MARPFGGYSENGVTLTAPGSVPGSAVEEPEAVTTTDSPVAVLAPAGSGKTRVLARGGAPRLARDGPHRGRPPS